jgi:hypothetical protein
MARTEKVGEMARRRKAMARRREGEKGNSASDEVSRQATMNVSGC